MSRLRIGVLGGGQLGRMMALAGYPLDLAFSFYDSNPTCPSAELGQRHGDAENSIESLDAFIDSADVFTYEFENIPVSWVERIAAKKPVYPSVKSLSVSQNRLNEKKLFADLKIPSARFAEIRSEADLHGAAKTLGLPLVIKTVTMGYDGKGQFLLHSEDQIPQAWSALGAQTPLMAEEFMHFKRELSIIAVRSRDGKTACYPLTENAASCHTLLRQRPLLKMIFSLRLSATSPPFCMNWITSAPSHWKCSKPIMASLPTRQLHACITQGIGLLKGHAVRSLRIMCAPLLAYH